MPDLIPVTQSAVALNVNGELPVVNQRTTSRVVVNNPLIRVVLFTFDTGQVLTEHSSPRAVVVTLLEGQMDFTLSDQTHRMDTGDVIYLAPNEPHALNAVTSCRVQLVMVDPTQVH